MAPRKTAPKSVDTDAVVAEKVDVKESPVVSESEHDEPVSDSGDSSSSKKKSVSRKPRTQANLDTVMSALEASDVEKAKKLLAKFIEKNGNGEKKRRVQPNGEKRPLSEYQQFMKDEMARLKLEDASMPAKQRMSTAVESWKARKTVAA